MNEFEELRKQQAILMNKKTTHGIPRNPRTHTNYDMSILMQEQLSKGHLSEHHKKNHIHMLDIHKR